MPKTVFRDKTALVLGADSSPGRAAAQQLSRLGCRTVLAGFDRRQIREIAEFLVSKAGKPLDCVLPTSREGFFDVILEARNAAKHFHYIVNVLPVLQGDPPGEFAKGSMEDLALYAEEQVLEAQQGKGAFRVLTVVARDSAFRPGKDVPFWYSAVRLGEEFASASAEDGEGIKPAALGDTIVWLLSCPPGACPVEVVVARRDPKS